MSKNYVEDEQLKEDIRTLYATGEFPERLANNLQEMVNRICGCRRFIGYTDDWKDEMKGAAIMALIKSLKEKRYDIDRPNSNAFSWATKVVFNQFYYWLASRKSKLKKERQYLDEAKCGIIEGMEVCDSI